MRKIKIYITMSFLFWASFVSAQDTLKLELDECRTMALKSSKEVEIANENVNKVKGEKMAARSAWFPNISASATGVYKKMEVESELYLPTQTFDVTTGELSPNVATNPLTGEVIVDADGNTVFNTYAYLPLDITIQGGVMAGVSVEQPIYAGGKIIAANKMAGIGESMASTNKELKKEEIVFQADKMYYTYLSVKAKVKLAKEYQTMLERLVKTVENSYETGMVNRNELLKIQVKYNEAVLQVQQAENGLKLAQMALCRVIGVDLYSQIEIEDSITGFSPPTADVDTVDATQRKEYKLLQEQVKLAEQKVKMVRGDYMPTAGISAGYNYFTIGLDDMDNYEDQGFMAMASIKIPITTFGERKGKVNAAKSEYNIKQLEFEQAAEYLQLEIEQARLNYKDAYTRVELTEKALQQASENMRVSDDNYSLGMETIVNLLEAKTKWQKAYTDKIDALTDFKIKESNFLRVSNGLIIPVIPAENAELSD